MGGLSAGGHLAAMTALERGPELGLAGEISGWLLVFFCPVWLPDTLRVNSKRFIKIPLG